jgi:hypothetical protein
MLPVTTLCPGRLLARCVRSTVSIGGFVDRNWTIAAVIASLCIAASGCGSDSDSKQESTFVPRGGTTASGSASSTQAAAPPERPKFAFPSHLKLKFDYPATGEPRKDQVLADLRTFWEARYYALANTREKRDQWKAYAVGDAATLHSGILENFRKDDSGVQGTVSFYRARVTKATDIEATVLECVDLRHYFGRNLRTGKREGTSSPGDYAQFGSRLIRGKKAWLVNFQTWKRGVTECKP